MANPRFPQGPAEVSGLCQLTALTSTKVTFGWSSATESAFYNLKSRFVSAPFLVTPDPTRQFVVEVDASEVGAGAVLFQCSLTDGKMHPCVFYSHCLSPADICIYMLTIVLLYIEIFSITFSPHWLSGNFRRLLTF